MKFLDYMCSMIIPLEEVALRQGNDIQAVLLADLTYGPDPTIPQVIMRTVRIVARIGNLCEFAGDHVQILFAVVCGSQQVSNLRDCDLFIQISKFYLMVLDKAFSRNGFFLIPRPYTAFRSPFIEPPHMLPFGGEAYEMREPQFFCKGKRPFQYVNRAELNSARVPLKIP